MTNPTDLDSEIDELLRRHHHLPTEQDIHNAYEGIKTDVADTASTRKVLEAIIARECDKARIAGMEQAKSRVLRRTEIPKDARNPTRDSTVILGEQIADIIQGDIDQLKAEAAQKGEQE
jgi:hypothetical protein